MKSYVVLALLASGAHNPVGTAVTAPSSKIPQSEMPVKK
jgi:hypothetical protein